ncbi:PAC2 family protein [Ktedonosporobacter rubrisoli]|uniref:PAC2 family protein n=1 Tax=Ktedonosporobacter rubrisoli TaxID=2509675 RepID=A0A4P6JRX5_KTERU|nr:PAC2 family protein [Ktedonosporobacter rubrisoli]QBD77576.1 PAC2 family protein [Ktedonosporobacter rubrisoli]
MSLIHYNQQPVLRDPIVVVAFGGWNDAADSATTAIQFLVDRWAPQKIAEIDSEEFFVFTETRPTIRLVDGIQRAVVWPTNQFLAHVASDLSHDVILFLGTEPQLKWKTFSNIFLDVCKHFNASEVVFLGALLADIPHSIAVPISGTSSNSEVKERLHEMDVHTSRYEGPTGIVGVLHDAFQQIHIPTASLWAAVPHYLAATPNIKVTAALLTYLNTYLSLGLDLSDIQSDAVHFEEQITALVARDPEASAYVRKLEEQLIANAEDEDEDEDEDDEEGISPDSIANTGPLPSADTLIRGVEELLRKQRENGQSMQDDDDEEEGR